jgi:hypothetical protein
MPSKPSQRFGARIRARFKDRGVGNLRTLFKRVGAGSDIIGLLVNREIEDTGAIRLAQAAIIAGIPPSEMFRDLEDTLLHPPLLEPDDAAAIALDGWPQAYPDQARLAVVADTVMQVVEDHGGPKKAGEVGEMVAALYEDFVRPNPAISHLELRRRVFAFLLDFDLPEPKSRRGPGRPPKVR